MQYLGNIKLMYFAEAVLKLCNFCEKMMTVAIPCPLLYSFDCIFSTFDLVLKLRYTQLVFSHGLFLLRTSYANQINSNSYIWIK